MTQIFPVVPPDPRLVWFLPGVFALAVAMGAVAWREPDPVRWALLAIALGSVGILSVMLRRRRVSITGADLVVAAGINTRRVAITDLDLSKARIVDLREHVEWKPAVRLFGTYLPGLAMGHFRLRDRSVAFVLLTERARVLVLTTRSGRRLLLSLTRPQALLEALRDASTTG